MIQRFATVLPLLLLLACRHGHQDAWNAPLAPALYFAETLTPGSVGVLVIDAHSGAPLPHSPVALNPGGPRVMTDSLGRARITAVRPGRYVLHVRSIGYHARMDSVSVTAASAFAAVIQLRRAKPNFRNVTVGQTAP